MIRARARQLLRHRLEQRSGSISRADLARDALVIAPHPDDETLGCGGLIAMKCDLGARVTVVFMTDGAGSHASDAAGVVASRRRDEATRATSILGVSPTDVHFLDIADGALAATHDEAVDLLSEIVRVCRADQIIVPHPLEPPSDHAAAFTVARRVAAVAEREFDALLYPVWLWDQWPWTNPLAAPRERHSRRQVLAIGIRDRLGFELTNRLSTSVDISSTLDRKIAALEAHASQMSRPEGRADWLTLGDVARGEWLEMLLQPTEYYESARLCDSAGSP